jgi:hypothetical protein
VVLAERSIGFTRSAITAGPLFPEALQVERGEVVELEEFVFADVLPSG